MMNQLLILLFFMLTSCSGKMIAINNKYIVGDITENGTTHYFLLNEKDTVLKLDSKKYFSCFSDTVENFLVVAPRNQKGWWAIDLKEKFLFQVYNTSPGEPSPDELNEGKIRMVDSTGKIGFANDKGEIIIKPQFEIVTAFSNGKAIIGQNCKKVPWEEHQDGADDHYSIICAKNGYINEQGEIIELGDFTFEDIVKKINWIDPLY